MEEELSIQVSFGGLNLSNKKSVVPYDLSSNSFVNIFYVEAVVHG